MINIGIGYLAIGLVLYLLFEDPQRYIQRLDPEVASIHWIVMIGMVFSFFVFVLAWPYLVMPGLLGLLGDKLNDRSKSEAP